MTDANMDASLATENNAMEETSLVNSDPITDTTAEMTTSTTATTTSTTTPGGHPKPTFSDPLMIEAWDRIWNVVQTNPAEFDAWEELMQLADRQEGGFGPEAPAANIENVRAIYDRFLDQFPLCFGYWKKYSDIEFMNRGVEAAIEIFERGVNSITNSVDLWVQYCTFVMDRKPEDSDQIEQLFERGAKHVGLDFMPHVFWDKYIEFLESKEEYGKLMKVMDRVIKIPMHQYARFFEKYAHLVSTRPIEDVISDEKYQEYKEQLTSSGGGEEKPKEQLDAEIRNQVLEASSLIYANTAAETNKRWPFEAEIKRPYFHVKPMDGPQLGNWRRYLDFEEGEDDIERIKVLYERCLVTCALYEEFWTRYGLWMRMNGTVEQVAGIYRRAVHFVPSTEPSARLSLALVEEELGNKEEARKHYQEVLKYLPGHLDTIVRFVNFERRMSPKELSAAEIVFANQLEQENVDGTTQMAIVTLYAKFLWKTKKDIQAARAIFRTGEGKFDSRFYFSNYLKFEMGHGEEDDDYESRVSNVFEQVRYSGLSQSIKNDYNQSYLDFLMEYGATASRYNQVEADIRTSSGSSLGSSNASESRKRPAEQQQVEGGSGGGGENNGRTDHTFKQARQDVGDLAMHASTTGVEGMHVSDTTAAV
ncbi:hypothetical protein BG004_005683 [Podila humilis]|nr:hypothetical protein BG004_005683 [Podila humilis]